jgi:hypothetical protein
MISKYRLAILFTIPTLLVLSKFYSWFIFGAPIYLSDYSSMTFAFLAPSFRDFDMLMLNLYYGISWSPLLVSISFIVYVLISYAIALLLAMCLIWIFTKQHPTKEVK